MTTRDDSNRSPPNPNSNEPPSASVAPQQQQVAIARTTHAQHGIYNALLSSTSSTNPYYQPSEMQMLERSISLTAAAPPLKLAPPFPGHCSALNASNLSAVQQIQRASQQHRQSSFRGQQYHQEQQQQHNQQHQFAASQTNSNNVFVVGAFNNNNNNNNIINANENFLSIGGISGRGDETSWKEADPSKTHAVVVALCLGRAAWDFPSDDAPVDLVNKGAPPLLSVDIGDDDTAVGNNNNNNNNHNNNLNNNNMNIDNNNNVNNNNNNNIVNAVALVGNQALNNNMNIFATHFINNNNQNQNNQDGNMQGGVAFYVEQRAGNGGGYIGGGGVGGGYGGGNQQRYIQQIMIMNQQLHQHTNNNAHQNAALAALQALAAKDVSATAIVTAGTMMSSTNQQQQQQQSQQQNQAQQGETNKNNTNNVSSTTTTTTTTAAEQLQLQLQLQQQQQLLQQQQHQTSLQAAVAAANNNNQATIHPPGAPSTLYSWRALRAHADVASRSCARAGEGIEALYLEMMKQKPETKNVKVITPLVNPTTENIRDVLHKGASDAADEMHRRNLNNGSAAAAAAATATALNQRIHAQLQQQQQQQQQQHQQPSVVIGGGGRAYTGTNKLLLHYIGHGVPRPERGCMYFARQATQRQHHAFTPVRDILQLMGTPCMLLCDCASAGNIKSAVVAVEREVNPYSGSKEHRYFWGSCSDSEPLPHHPLMPDDLFSSIMISPIRMAVLFFIVQRKNLYDFPPYLVHCFASEWAPGLKAGNPVAEVRNAFNAIVESIAAKVLSPDVFYICFRQDAVVMNLFRAFILAQRVIGSLGCEPCSHPHIPSDTAFHSLWQSFDFVVEGVLGSIMRQWRPKPSHGLSVHSFRMALDPTLVLKNMQENPSVPVSTFFQDSLISLQGQFDSAQAQALVAGSVVDPPSSSQSHHSDLLSYPVHQDEVLTSMHQQFALLQRQFNNGRNANNGRSHQQYAGAGAGGAYPHQDEDGVGCGGFFDSGGAVTVDFASYLLTRGNNCNSDANYYNYDNYYYEGGGDNNCNSNVAGLSDQQVQELLGSDDFPSRELISFVGTRFPILQHSLASRDTRFFALVILARWLDLGALAVDCCELFGLYREILAQLWTIKPVDDQDPVMVMIGAKTCMIDAKILLVQKSLHVPVTYCARVFNNPQEPRDYNKLGILGLANTQRWFSAATIALSLLRQPHLSMTCLIKSDPGSSISSPNSTNPNFNPHLAIVAKLSCPVAKTCVEILVAPIPPKPRNAPDSDTEPSIASNLKSTCLAVLGCIAFSLRGCFSASFPLLPALSIVSFQQQQQNPQQQQQHFFQQQQQQQQYVLQLLQQQFVYQNIPAQNQIRFVTQFFLPALKDGWIDAVGALLSQKDSTPRVRWGSVRALHIFLVVLTRIYVEASTNRKHILELVLPPTLRQQKHQQHVMFGSGNNVVVDAGCAGSAGVGSPTLHTSTTRMGSVEGLACSSATVASTRDQQLLHDEASIIGSLDPQLQHHLSFLSEIADTANSLQVAIVGKLVTHCSKTEGNVDVRREVLGAVTAFCLSQSDVMLSNIIQGEMRALFTGTASPNRFGTLQQHQQHQVFPTNQNQNQQQQQQQQTGNTGGGSHQQQGPITPNSHQLLQNHQARMMATRSVSDFDPTVPLPGRSASQLQQQQQQLLGGNNANNNNNNNNLTGNLSQFLVSGQTTPQVSAIGTPMKQAGGAASSVHNQQHIDESNFISRNTSRLDHNNNINNSSLLSPAQGGAGGHVRSVPFQQQHNQQSHPQQQQQQQQQQQETVQQNLFGNSQPQQMTPNANHNNNINNNNNNSSTIDLSAETNVEDYLPSMAGHVGGALYLLNAARPAATIIDRRVIVLLVVVRWILSLRNDAHPVLRVLCIRSLQKFVTEQIITLGLFTRPAPHQEQRNQNFSIGRGARGGGDGDGDGYRMSGFTSTFNNGTLHEGDYGPLYDEADFDSSSPPRSVQATSNQNRNQQQSFPDSIATRNPSYINSNNNNNNNNNSERQPASSAQQQKKTVFDRVADFFGGNKQQSQQSQAQNQNQNQQQQQQQAKSGTTGSHLHLHHNHRNSHIDPSAPEDHQHPQHANLPHHSHSPRDHLDPINLDKFLFSESDAATLFDFEAPALSLLDLDSSDIAVVEFVNEMLRAISKPIIPRICQRVSLGDLPPRFSRPQTTAAAINAACSAPLVGDVAPHRCVFHSYVKRTLAQAKCARHDTALSDIVQRHVYPQIDAAHVVFHPSEPFAVCCSSDEVLSVVSTAPRDRRVLNSQRMDRILPNGVEENIGGGGDGHGGRGGDDGLDDSSEGESFRTPQPISPRFGAACVGGNNNKGVLNGVPKRTSALVLLDAVYSHTVAVVASDSCVRVVTDIANRSGIRIATAFPGLSSSFDTAAAILPYYGGSCASSTLNATTTTAASAQQVAGSTTNNLTQNSLAAYQALGQRLLVTGDSHRFALWDVGQQRKLDERFALPSSVVSSITCVCPFSGSPESFVLGLNRSIVITDHRMKDTTAGTLHIPQAFAGAGCVALVSHLGAQHKITGVSYSGLTCIWDVRYSMEIGDSRSILPGYGQTNALQPGMSRSAFPRAGYLPGTAPTTSTTATTSSSSSSSSPTYPNQQQQQPQVESVPSKVTTAAIHPLFSEAPLVAGGVNSKFKVMLPDQVLAQRNEQPIVCAWHPFEVVGAVVPWTAEVSNRRLEIFAAASKDQRTDHIVDLIL